MKYLVIDMVDGSQWKLEPEEHREIVGGDGPDCMVRVPLNQVADLLRAGGWIRFDSEVEHQPPEGVEEWKWEGEPDCPATVYLFGRGVMQVIEVREPEVATAGLSTAS